MPYQYHHCDPQDIPHAGRAGKGHAFLGVGHGEGGHHKLSPARSAEIALGWCLWFCGRHVPHVAELDEEGHVIQIYKRLLNCCRLHAHEPPTLLQIRQDCQLRYGRKALDHECD